MSENRKIAVCVSAGESEKVNSVLSSLGYEKTGFGPDSLSLIRTVITDMPRAVIADTKQIAREELIRAFAVLENTCRPVCIVLGENEDSPLSGLSRTYCLSVLPDAYALGRLISGDCESRDNASGNIGIPAYSGGAYTVMEDRITKIIRKIGIPANIKGYRYIRTAILLVIEDPSLLESVTKGLYPEIALRHSATPARVERAIRHAITVAWDRAEGDEEYLCSRLHCRIDFSGPRPTNSELIALISDSLMMEARGRKSEHFMMNV